MMALGGLGALVHIPPAVSIPSFAALFLVVSRGIMRRLGFDRGLMAIVLGGAVFYLGYLTYTSDLERNYDGPEQFRYLGFVLDHGRLPAPTYCTICHHPPLYYAVAAGWIRVVMMTRLVSFPVGLQLLSWLLFLGFIGFAVLILKHFVRTRWVLYLATALVVFWPYSVINSVRVHNDALVYPLLAAAIYFVVKWRDRGSTRDLYLAAAFAGLGALTKSSAYILILSLGILLGWDWAQARRKGNQATNTLFAWLVLVVGVVLSSLDKLGWTRYEWRRRVLGAACYRPADGSRGDPWWQYLTFDLRTFCSEPFLIIHRAEPDRDPFWMALLKSSLFGTYNDAADPELSVGLYSDLARLLNVLFLAMLAVTLVGLVTITRQELRARGTLLLVGAVSVSLLMLFRMICPNPHHTDFRHVFPLVIPGALFFAESVARLRRRTRILGGVGYALGLLFLLVSVSVFFPRRG
jgi:hypothetical protein